MMHTVCDSEQKESKKHEPDTSNVSHQNREEETVARLCR